VGDAFLVGLDVAEQERRVRADAHPVGDPVDLEPAVGPDLLLEQDLAHPLAEHLGAAARHRVHAGLDHLGEHLLDRLARQAAEEVDLDRGPGLDLEVGVLRPELAHDVDVVLVLPPGVESADHVDLTDPALAMGQDLLHVHLVAVGIAGALRVVAEDAVEHALVGRVELAVEDEVGAVAVEGAAVGVGHAAEGQDVVGLEHDHAVLERHPLAGLEAVPDLGKARVAKADRDVDGKRVGHGGSCLPMESACAGTGVRTAG
jgi:hypothetical protein